MKNKFLTAFLSAFIFTATLKATTYYISPNGNDNNSGTSLSQAWKSINKINSTSFAPGSIILFEGGGTFTGSIYIDNGDGNEPSNPIVFSSYGTGKAIINSGAAMGFYAHNTQGVTVSNLIFEGSGASINNSDGVMFFTNLSGNTRLSNINIINLEVRYYGKTGVSIASSVGNSGYKNVIIDGVHVHHIKTNGIMTSGYTSKSHVGWSHQNVTIKNSEVHDVTGYSDPGTHRGSGIILGQVDGGLIEKCSAHHNGSANTHCGGPGGIWTWDSNSIIIQSSESYKNSSGSGCDGLGFDLDGGVTNSIMQYNYSHDNDGAGYLLGQYSDARAWTNNIIRYNISENDGRTNGGGFTLFNGPGSSMSGCKIYNNTVHLTPSATNPNVGAFTIIDWAKNITGIEVYNNIFQTTGGASLVDVPVGYSAFFAGNLYWSSGAAFKIKYQGATYSSIAAWRTATNNEKVNSTLTGVTANPNFNNSGSGAVLFPNQTYQLNAYKLSAGSPAINVGLNLTSLYGMNTGSRDFFGNPVGSTGMTSIGAHGAIVNIATSLGLINKNSEEIILYPNPVRSGDPIFVKGIELPYSAELISITGQLVWKKDKIETEKYPIPTGNFAAGPYILLLNDANDQKKTHKLIIQ
ncbi:MAG: T9SS type A sorting domain-containing protein [Bacteroidota bacterium]